MSRKIIWILIVPPGLLRDSLPDSTFYPALKVPGYFRIVPLGRNTEVCAGPIRCTTTLKSIEKPFSLNDRKELTSKIINWYGQAVDHLNFESNPCFSLRLSG